MNGKPEVEEQYKRGDDVINYVVYPSKTGPGNDEVLQHKISGLTESAHITLHPDGTVNFRVKRIKLPLENAVRTGMQGYAPSLSDGVKKFLSKIRGKI